MSKLPRLHLRNIDLMEVGAIVRITGPSKSQRHDAIGRMGEVVAILFDEDEITTIQVRESPQSVGDYSPSSVDVVPSESLLTPNQCVTVAMVIKAVNYIEGKVAVQALWEGGMSEVISIPLSCLRSA